MKSLPPLNALRAFECAARHLSLSQAAQELNVTPGAISQQVKLLEDCLDMRLFIRKNRMILLTETGQLLLPGLTKAFNQLEQSIDLIESQQREGPLTISAPPSFVAKWLIPRLNQFNRTHPDIEIRIDSSTRLVDFDNEDIDVGIRFSQDQDKTLDATHLMSLEMIAVCSPELAQSHNPLHQPADIQHHTLLHFDSGVNAPTWPDWNMWLATMGIDSHGSPGIMFNQVEMLIQAAIESQGIALVASVFVENELNQKRLVRAFDQSMPVRFCYFLVSSRYKARQEKVRRFKQWIVNECLQQSTIHKV